MKPKLVRRTTIAALGAAVAALVVTVPAASAPAAGPTTATPTAVSAPAAAAACPALVCSKLKVEGTSRMAKLGADVALVPGVFDAKAFFENLDPVWPLRIEGDITLPTVRDAYLVVLRFMPSTNDISFVQEGKVTGRGRIVQPPNRPPGLYIETDVVAKLVVHLANVRQDGIDLKVGNDCRTRAPAEIPIHAVIPLEVGATAKSEATFGLPAFTGCGSTEDLDPLFTGLVSGPGNTLRSTLTVISLGAT